MVLGGRFGFFVFVCLVGVAQTVFLVNRVFVP